MNARDWLTRYGVTFDWSADGFHLDRDGWEHQRFTVTLTRRDGETLEIPWRQGLGVEDDPTPAAVLPAVAYDIRVGMGTWEDFASDFHAGDPEEAPLSLYRTWEACRDQYRRARDWCTSEDMWSDLAAMPEED